MARTLLLSETPWRAAQAHMDGPTVITPNSDVAQSLGVAYRPLSTLRGGTVASDGDLMAALRAALQAVPVVGERPALLRLIAELTALSGPEQAIILRDVPPLAGVWSEIRAFLGRRGLRHPDEPVPPVAAGRLLIAGFSHLTAAELALIDASASDGSVVVLPRTNRAILDSHAETLLAARGWVIEYDASCPQDVGEALAARFAGGPPTPTEGVAAHLARDVHAEARQTLGRVHAQRAAGESVLIVVPDVRSYGPALEAWAWEYGVSLDVKQALRLAQTRLGAWLAALFNVLQGEWDMPSVLKVLGHPITGDYPAALRRKAALRRPSSHAAWLRFGLPRVLADWPTHAPLPKYIQQLYTHLEAIDITILSDAEVEAGVKLIDLLGEVPSSAPVALADFARLALGLLQEPFELPQNEAGVAVRLPADVPARRFDHMHILGLSEGWLPAPVGEPPLLDYLIRRDYAARGLAVRVAADDVRDRERTFWEMLGTARRSLTMSYPARRGKHTQLPSPYFQALSLTPQPAGDATPISAQEQLSAAIKGGQRATVLQQQVCRALEAAGQRRRGDSGVYQGSTGQPLALEDHVFSATQLTRLGQCPYRWYAQYVLKVEEPEASDAELLPHERGQLYHRVLELVALQADETQDRQLESLSAAFERVSREQGLGRRSAWSRQAPEHLERLTQAVRDDTFLPAGHRVSAVELPFDVTWHGLRVTGQIDRVDLAPDGGLVVTDYKSGTSKPRGAKDSSGRANVDVQLPLYLEVVAQLHPDVGSVGGRYLSLSKRDRRVLASAPLKAGALNDLVASVHAMAASGEFPAEPDVDRHACAKCPYVPLCRHPMASGGAEQ